MTSTPALDARPDAQRVPADFGPSLPQLLRQRFGVRERVTTAATAVLVLIVGGGLLLRAVAAGPEHLVYHAGPTFNLQYSTSILHRVAPSGDELVRLEAHRGKLFASVTISRLHLPSYAGNVTSGLLPVYENGYERSLRRGAPNFRLNDQGSARVNDAQGYQLGFRTGPPGRFTWGRDMLLVPGDEGVRDGVLIKLRQTKAGSLTKRDQKVLGEVQRAVKSFNFGTDPGKW